jgi:diguanylate cyclase (GGDEF)-like protein
VISRILVAGSDEILSPECRIPLDASGYRLKNCASLREAMALIFEDPPDLLLTEKGFSGKLGDTELILAVKSCLHKANIPILLVLSDGDIDADLDWDRYPVDDILLRPVSPQILLTRVRLAESRMVRAFDNNPLSRLPGNTSIIRAIQRVLEAKEEAAVCTVDIDNFKPYNDRYGFSRGDEVILMVARIIANVVEELAREGSFIGHIGGDDFVFIVYRDKVEAVCRKILAHFDKVRNMFLSAEDIAANAFVGRDRQERETRFPLLSLSIAVVTTNGGKYTHYGEVSSVATHLKHYPESVKELQ